MARSAHSANSGVDQSENELISHPYQCTICNQSYGRPDHLIRHVRSHTKRRPYICPSCSRKFFRLDILKRHQSMHFNSDRQLNNVLGSQGERVQQACKRCASKKLKCSNQKPCARCQSKKLECEYEAGENNALTLPPPTASSAKRMESQQLASSDEQSAIATEFATASTSLAMQPDIYDWPGFDQDPLNIPTYEDSLESLFASEMLFSDVFLTSGAENFHFSPTTIEKAAHSNPIFQWVAEPNGLNSTTDCRPGRWLVLKNEIAAEAFNISPMTRPWEPKASDTLGNEHESLTLPRDIKKDKTFHVTNTPDRCLQLSSEMRDRILSIILANCPREALDWVQSVSSCFPSTDTLSSLLQLYAAGSGPFELTEFIHLPSINVNNTMPELVAMMIAKGGVEAISPAIRKFCYALQQIIRNASVQSVGSLFH